MFSEHIDLFVEPSNVVLFFSGVGDGGGLVTDLGGTRDARSLSVQIFHFHTVFGKEYARYNRLFPLPPSEILDLILPRGVESNLDLTKIR